MANATRPSNNPPVTTTKVKEVKKEKEKKVRAKHPSVGSSDKAVYPFKVVPTDFDITKFQGLKKKDFEKSGDGEAGFFEYRAMLADNAAKKFRAMAVEARAGGGAPTEDRKALKRLSKAATKLAELQKQLGAKYDIAALIAAAKAKVEESAAEPTKA